MWCFCRSFHYLQIKTYIYCPKTYKSIKVKVLWSLHHALLCWQSGLLAVGGHVPNSLAGCLIGLCTPPFLSLLLSLPPFILPHKMAKVFSEPASLLLYKITKCSELEKHCRTDSLAGSPQSRKF